MPGTMFIQASSMAALPRSGAAYGRLQAAGTADPGTGNLGLIDQTHPTAVLSIALYAVATNNATLKQKVIDEIKAVMGTELSAPQPLNPYRVLLAYIWAADLVDMPGSTVGANGMTFNAWMQGWPSRVIPGQTNWNTLLKCAKTSGNNWGMCARASLAGVYAWLKKVGLNPTGAGSGDPTTAQAGLDSVVQWFRRACGDTSVPNTFTATGSFQAAWATSTFPGSQGVINPDVTGTKSWQSGANCEDASRSTYPTKTGAGQHYQYESLDSYMSTIILLINIGYTTAATYGNNGVRRNYEYMIDNGLTTPSADFHHYCWMQPRLANWMFPGLGFPIPPNWLTDYVSRRNLPKHMDWLTNMDNIGSVSTWLTIAGAGADPGSGGGTETPTVAAPTVNVTATVSGQTLTLNATGSTAGSSPIVGARFTFGDGTVFPSSTTFTSNDLNESHTYTISQTTTFTWKVEVAGQDGAIGTKTGTATINTADRPPIAQFTVTPLSGEAPLTISYDFTGTVDPDGNTLAYSVNFGDGAVLNPAPISGTHTFTDVTTTTTRNVVGTATANGKSSVPISRLVTVYPSTVSAGFVMLYWAVGGRLYPVNPNEVVRLATGAPLPADILPNRTIIRT